MPEERFTLKNNGGFEFNDNAHDRAFDLVENEYRITITPKSQFWRFGIRFGKTGNIIFYHPNGRYNNPDFPNIELNVGFKEPSGDWKDENQIELGTYYVPGLSDSILDRWAQYESMVPVEITLVIEELTGILSVSYRVNTQHVFEKKITLPGIKYFKVFAWADFVSYEMDILVQWSKAKGISKEVQTSTLTNSKLPDDLQSDYGLIKLAGFKIDRSHLKVGNRGILNWSFDDDLDVVTEIDYQKFIRKAGKFIGILEEQDDDVAIAVLNITGFRKETQPGRFILEYEISTVLNPAIKLQPFASLISSEFLKDKFRRAIPINADQFEQILNSGQTEGKRSYFLPYFITEGDHRNTEDQLEFNNDIESVASVMALKTVAPPLAIGLFGKWGSGKSFFMDKLALKIEEYASRKTPEYIEDVVQVKFNSWHYSDSNLWASLMTRIFDEMKRHASGDPEKLKTIFENLNSTKEILAETTKQKADVERQIELTKFQLSAVESEIVKDAENLKELTPKDLFKIVSETKFIKDDFDSIQNEYKFLQLEELSDVKENLQELAGNGNQLVETLKLVYGFRKGKRWLYILTAAVFAAGAYWLIGVLNFAQTHLTEIRLTVVLISTVLSQVVFYFRPAMKVVKAAYARLQALTDSYKKLESDEIQKNQVKVKKAQDELDLAKMEKQQLDIQIEKLKFEEINLEEKIRDIQSGKKLVHFIENRVADKRYLDHLGIISWIRKDFEDLDSLLRQQIEIIEAGKGNVSMGTTRLKIDRIVLYIDDLDRCNEDVVVKVLEAIHLLLAFPLFIVIVGVDPRWLNNALNKKMDTLFGKAKKDNNEKIDAELITNSYDYLEKIFQIPFAIKPISKTSGQSLVKYLMRNEMEKADEETLISGTIDISKAGATVFSKETSDELYTVGGNSLERSNIPALEHSPLDILMANEPKKIQEDRVVLSFRKEELEFIQQISPLFTKSPRTINSYINIYRIIRSHRSLDIADQSVVDEYLPVMFMLSIIVGYNELAPEFIASINDEKPDTSLQKWLEYLKDSLPINKIKFGKLYKEIHAVVDGVILNKPVYAFRKNLALISRFSFRSI